MLLGSKNKKVLVPCDIYQTWPTPVLPPKMQERVNLLKQQNPQFRHFLFDDKDCRTLIQTHFQPDVLHAYDVLVPGAYKADLWRYCVLFVFGGIYMDIKMGCINGFKLIELTKKNHFVQDRWGLGIYNAVMVSQPGNIFLWKCIQEVVKNVGLQFYGPNPLAPTGPTLMKKVALQNRFHINLDLKHVDNGGYILFKNKKVFTTDYPEYNAERSQTYQNLRTQHYDQLWRQGAIYVFKNHENHENHEKTT